MDERLNRATQALTNFLATPLDTQLQTPREPNILNLFQDVAATVPAYQAFLQEHDINPSSIKTLADFQQLPPITKENYLQKYPISALCRHGKLETCDMIAVSSGSTGKPTFWGRFFSDELQIATRFEQIFHDSFAADTRRTLAVICFTLGTWVGGMYTTNCCRYLAWKGYPLTVVTPGNHKEEIFRVVGEMGKLFDQVVLLGYPPFLKDVIDTGIARGIPWKEYQVKLVMAGEVFSEEWRSLVGERIGAVNPCYDSASLYGTADAGVLGNETPLSICIRRFLGENPEAARKLFGESRLPTLVQYDPQSRFFEVVDNTLLFSGDNGIPLIRYNILDRGGIIGYGEMLEFLAEYNFHPTSELTNVRHLPFVYVFGRSNFTVSYFGANIYPENVTVGLEQPVIQDWVTGKFVLQVLEDTDKNKLLTVVVELAPGVEADSGKKEAIATAILTQLRRLNSEFANYVPPEYQTPQVTLKPMGDVEYFPLGVKHRYTRK
ncbi:phenylacetate--CoA ligase family protein [Calothrix sp. 336/3]|uniref:phenylacetate--CoA ligase family protein n=1 Tax=Calothrix sp. 336/3 TaxID=1337936 RepID=UPI0004E2E8A1|nr:phenylacetate--CoA ligase family protein [Calothrix sp. 336/3]AKG20179.1 phenylacetate--CoA ligase [Calothrix sp. 336/3]